MKIALINENSQAAKNALTEATLRKVVEPMGHEVVNYGMYAADDAARIAHAVEHLGQDHEHQRDGQPEDIDGRIELVAPQEVEKRAEIELTEHIIRF